MPRITGRTSEVVVRVHVVELASGVTLAEVMAKTGAVVTAKKGALAAD
jgi:hypothetical protein